MSTTRVEPVAVEFSSRDSIDYTVAGHSVADIVNYNELLVLQAVKSLLERDAEICRCRLCVEDLYALTLNALPARYVQVFSVHKYMASPAFVAPDEVVEQLALAAERIRRNPKH